MHLIRGFIAKDEIIDEIVKEYHDAKRTLNYGYSIFFTEDDLINDLGEFNSNFLYKDFFSSFAEVLLPIATKYSKNNDLAYIETEYYGGIGRQTAVLFRNSELVYGPFLEPFDENAIDLEQNVYEDGAINLVLKKMNIERKNFVDEFESLGLSSFRSMIDKDNKGRVESSKNQREN